MSEDKTPAQAGQDQSNRGGAGDRADAPRSFPSHGGVAPPEGSTPSPVDPLAAEVAGMVQSLRLHARVTPVASTAELCRKAASALTRVYGKLEEAQRRIAQLEQRL